MPETDLQPLFDYDTLTPAVREMVQEHTGEIRTLARRAAQDIVEIGERLLEVKGALEHGQFQDWVQVEFGWSYRAAARFMQVTDAFKSANLADLNIAPSALYALASGTTPPAIREELVERAQAGEPITNKVVTERLEQHRQQFQPEAVVEPVTPPSPPPTAAPPAPVTHTPASPEPQPAPVAPPAPVKAVPTLAPPVKRTYNPLDNGTEPLELEDGTVIQVPSLPLLPREREIKQKDYAAAANRFDSAASKVLAALTALDVYSMEEVAEISESPEGRQLFAPVRVARIKEMLEQVGEKWLGSKAPTRTIDAAPLIEVLPPKKDTDRTLEMN